jgi:acyl dehydratase
MADDLTFTTEPLDRDRIRQFSLAMQDPNPVHLDDDFARSIGLQGVIAPGGLAVVAMAHAVVRRYGIEAIREIDVSFKAPMQAGEQLVCTAEVVETAGDTITLSCRATNPAGDLRAQGVIRVAPPSAV